MDGFAKFPRKERAIPGSRAAESFPQRGAAKRPPRSAFSGGGSGEAGRWDDPDDSDGALGSDRDSEHEATLASAEGPAPERLKQWGRDAEKFAEWRAPLGGSEGLWDPLEGMAARKRRKVGQQKPDVAAAARCDTGTGLQGNRPGESKTAKLPGNTKATMSTGQGPLPEGTTVCLVDLQKAPHLNGKIGQLVGDEDGATGRSQILLEDGSVKAIRRENLRVVLTGSLVRFQNLVAAPELNGKIGECRALDVVAERYSVLLPDGTERRVKEPNLQQIQRYVTPRQMLSVQRRPFRFQEATQRFRSIRAWADQLDLLTELKLPIPSLVPACALVAFTKAIAATKDPKVARRDLCAAAVDARDASIVTTENGSIACRLLAVSTERDACFPSGNEKPSDEELRRLGVCAEKLEKRDSKLLYFLIPNLCVANLPILRAGATCAWPLYIQLCQALICLDSEYRSSKAWCRLDQRLAGAVFSKPVYILPWSGMAHQADAAQAADDGWLLSDAKEDVAVGAVVDGQVLPGEERSLVEVLANELLEGGFRGVGPALTCYRL